eukprot:snap_masked-scaffold_10-processed-gene-8.22-mRNA-1 protein AED:1.00 eAED:1.00 QI:0/0/0/0/1/1/2/0/65
MKLKNGIQYSINFSSLTFLLESYIPYLTLTYFLLVCFNKKNTNYSTDELCKSFIKRNIAFENPKG